MMRSMPLTHTRRTSEPSAVDFPLQPLNRGGRGGARREMPTPLSAQVIPDDGAPFHHELHMLKHGDVL